MPDEVRRLGRTGGYVPDHGRALAAEQLEAVSEEEQQRQTDEAHRKALDARIERREATAGDVQREVDHLEGRLRYLRRQLKRLQRVPS